MCSLLFLLIINYKISYKYQLSFLQAMFSEDQTTEFKDVHYSRGPVLIPTLPGARLLFN